MKYLRIYFFIAVSFSACVSACADHVLTTLYPPITAAKVTLYLSQVKLLTSNPKALSRLKPNELLDLQSQIQGAYFNDKMPKNEWGEIRSNEVILTGLIVMSLESWVDPAFDIAKAPIGKFPSYELSDREGEGTDAEKRKKYDEWVKAQIEVKKKFDEQWHIRKDISVAVEQAQYYFGRDFSDRNEIIAILKKAQISQPVIDMITGPRSKIL